MTEITEDHPITREDELFDALDDLKYSTDTKSHPVFKKMLDGQKALEKLPKLKVEIQQQKDLLESSQNFTNEAYRVRNKQMKRLKQENQKLKAEIRGSYKNE